MEFEFDPAKSASNLAKHGIDFLEAKQLWADKFAAVVDARSDSEPRTALIAQNKGNVWIAFFTEQQGKTRLISVRRARVNEERIYYEGTGTR